MGSVPDRVEFHGSELSKEAAVCLFYTGSELSKEAAVWSVVEALKRKLIFWRSKWFGDEIYSTVDACNTANEMWTAIERLQQGESLNIQDVKTNLFWEFRKVFKHLVIENPMVSDEDSDPEQAQRDKDMQKNCTLFAKYFKKLYKPTNNNLRTSSNSKNKTEDTTPRYNNDNQSGQFGNQRTMTVAGGKDDYVKQLNNWVPLQGEQADWLAYTDEEIDEQELEAHYSFMAKIQEVYPKESRS
ncbi:hypothetical protein Tco_1229426 [Tanacetum coccineum]